MENNEISKAMGSDFRIVKSDDIAWKVSKLTLGDREKQDEYRIEQELEIEKKFGLDLSPVAEGISPARERIFALLWDRVVAYRIWLSLRRKQPDITLERVKEIVNDDNQAKFLGLQSFDTVAIIEKVLEESDKDLRPALEKALAQLKGEEDIFFS